MVNILTAILVGFVILTLVAEFYKATFEHNKESQDERGKMITYKIKSFSYTFLTGGIIIGVILVAIFELFNRELFIFYVMFVFFIQSIASSIYLAIVRKYNLVK